MEIERRDLENKSKYLVWNDYGSRVIGSATLVDSIRPVLLEEINVRSNRRGRGVGSTLLKQILNDFDNSEIMAEAFSSRLGWYRRHGFEAEEKAGRLVRVRRTP